jgi:hypothetical protein
MTHTQSHIYACIQALIYYICSYIQIRCISITEVICYAGDTQTESFFKKIDMEIVRLHYCDINYTSLTMPWTEWRQNRLEHKRMAAHWNNMQTFEINSLSFRRCSHVLSPTACGHLCILRHTSDWTDTWRSVRLIPPAVFLSRRHSVIGHLETHCKLPLEGCELSLLQVNSVGQRTTTHKAGIHTLFLQI